MIAQFFDMQLPLNPLNGTRLGDRKDLQRLLDTFRSREPFFCELVGENGFTLLLGIGRVVGCAQYSATDGSTPYLVAKTVSDRDFPLPPGEIQFLAADTPSEVPKRYGLPPEIVREVAAYFLETGNRAPMVEWEEI